MKGICQKHPQEDIDRTGYCDACIAEKGSPLATDPTHLTNPEREAVGNAAIDDVNEWGNTQPIAKCLPRTNAAIERILTARLAALDKLLREAREKLRGVLDSAKCLALEIEEYCPCGARPESPGTHPHVSTCPVDKLVRLLWAAAAQGENDEK